MNDTVILRAAINTSFSAFFSNILVTISDIATAVDCTTCGQALNGDNYKYEGIQR
jgi:hypothetical protein